MTETLHIWGRITSINVRKVVWTAQELGLTVQRTDAGGRFGIVTTPEYTALNPNSLVPVIEDGDFVLWESNTIVRYLCAKHAPDQFYPTVLTERFVAEQWMDWQQTTMNNAMRDAFIGLIRTAPEQRDAEAIARSQAQTEPLMQLLDAHLADRAYVCGERFGMADIPLGCEAHRWLNLPQQRAALPNVERWFDALKSRSGAIGVLDQALA